MLSSGGNRHGLTSFEDGEYQIYKDLLGEAARKSECEVWCYCLMSNHVHLVVVPGEENGLRRTFADAHRRYTDYINFGTARDILKFLLIMIGSQMFGSTGRNDSIMAEVC